MQDTSMKKQSLLHAGFFYGLFVDPYDGGDVLPKRRFTFTRLHNVMSQKMELFMVTAWKPSNPTFITVFTTADPLVDPILCHVDATHSSRSQLLQ
jgi:hypothetical protein